MGMFRGVPTLFTCPNGVEISKVEHAPASLSSNAKNPRVSPGR
jgi:hypothetical protein